MWLGGDRVLLAFPALLFDDEEEAAAAAAAKSEAEKPGGGGIGANDEEALDMAVPGYPPLTSNGFARTLFFWLGVALSTLLVVWRRFRAAADAELPLVRGEDTDEGEEDEETPDAPAAVDEEDRRFRNSASFAARA